MEESVSRRGFISALIAAGAGAALTGCSPRSVEEEKGKVKLDGGSFDIVVIWAGGAGRRRQRPLPRGGKYRPKA